MISNVRAYLMTRFIIALCLLLALMTFTLFLFSTMVQSSDHDAYVINASGAQRMNSQRIALMAREISGAQSQGEADTYAAKMRVNYNRMYQNHKELSSGVFKDGVTRELEPKIKNLYFGENRLDEDVSEYLDLASQFLDIYDRQGFEAAKNSPLIDQIVGIARNGFLDKLDRAVFEYERIAADRIGAFQNLQRLSYIIGIVLLGLIFAFILRPVVKRMDVLTSDLTYRNDELVEFSYRISHDLRSPIKSVKGLMGLANAASQTGDKDGLENIISMASKSLNKLETLTEDIIMLSKMKLSEIAVEPVHIKDLVKSSLASVQNIDGAEEVEFATEYTLMSEIVPLKRLYLSQSLENLLSNAIKYRDKSKAQSKVEIHVAQSGDSLTIEISDNGIGIPKDRANNLFEMFQRFHPNQSYGSGLGLYLVAQNAAALGGEIKYTPLTDGSQFTIQIPISKLEEKAA